MNYSRIEVIPAETPAESKAKTPEKAVPNTIGQDEAELLKIYRKAKRIGYADISVTIQEGKRVKLWLTEKIK